MGRKKKKDTIKEEEKILDEIDNIDDIYEPQDDSNLYDSVDNANNADGANYDFSEDNMAANALHYASIVSAPSNTANQFKHVPKETRYSFLGNDEVKELKHWDKNYRNYMYLKKVLMLQASEDVEILNNRLTLYTIKSQEDLKEYCKKNNILISYNMIKNKPELVQELLVHINTLNESGFYEDIKNQNQMVKDIYTNYNHENQRAKYIDDLGMAGNIFTTSLIAMGRHGNERKAQVTTISVTKDIDMIKEQEERTDYKQKVGHFFKKKFT